MEQEQDLKKLKSMTLDAENEEASEHEKVKDQYDLKDVI